MIRPIRTFDLDASFRDRVLGLREKLGREPTAFDVEREKAEERARQPQRAMTFDDPGTGSAELERIRAS